MRKTSKSKIEKVIVVFGYIFLLMLFSGLFFPVEIYIENKTEAYRQLLIFYFWMIVAFVFIYFARYQLNNFDEKSKIEKSDEKFARVRAVFYKIAELIHLLPLFLILIVIKTNLMIEYKVFAVLFLLVAYMMVGLSYTYKMMFKFTRGIMEKMRIKGFSRLVVSLVLILVLIILGTMFFAYDLILFYYNRFGRN